MPKSAITDLEQQIEAVRREAFAAGYAAAMEEVRELASRSAPQGEATAAAPSRHTGSAACNSKAHPLPPNSRSHQYRYPDQRPPRGHPHPPVRPLAARHERADDRRDSKGSGAERPPTSGDPQGPAGQWRYGILRLDPLRARQLERRNAAEQPESKTWRATGDAPETRSAPVADAGPTD